MPYDPSYVSDALAHGITQDQIDSFIANNPNDYHRLRDAFGYADPNSREQQVLREVQGPSGATVITTQPAISSISIASSGERSFSNAGSSLGRLTVSGEAQFAQPLLAGSAMDGGDGDHVLNVNATGSGLDYSKLALIGGALVLFWLFGNKLLK